MSGFDEREKGQLAKIKHDDELHFRVVQRRNKLLGLWAAGLLGLKNAEADAYARTVIDADFQKPGIEDLVEKLMADFAARNVEMNADRIRKQIERLFAEAAQQVRTE